MLVMIDGISLLLIDEFDTLLHGIPRSSYSFSISLFTLFSNLFIRQWERVLVVRKDAVIQGNDVMACVNIEWYSFMLIIK
jgi:hypothetical protein